MCLSEPRMCHAMRAHMKMSTAEHQTAPTQKAGKVGRAERFHEPGEVNRHDADAEHEQRRHELVEEVVVPVPRHVLVVHQPHAPKVQPKAHVPRDGERAASRVELLAQLVAAAREHHHEHQVEEQLRPAHVPLLARPQQLGRREEPGGVPRFFFFF